MRPTERPVLHLVDGSGYIFRAYYAIPPLSARDGTPTNAVLGFAKMLNKLLRQDAPHHLGMAFDTGNKNYRHDLYPSYKGNRPPPPDDLVPQFALIHELIERMDVPILQLDGYEADDVLATLAKQAVEQGYRVVVVSGDKDLMQLVGPHVSLFDPLKNQTFGRDDVIKRFGVPPEHIADALALAGDMSDNIPGIPKVGRVTAANLIRSFGDVEAVLAGLASKQESERRAVDKAVLHHAEAVRLYRRLTVLCDDAPIALRAEALAYAPPKAHKLGPFLRRLDAWALLKDFGIDADDRPISPNAPVSAEGGPSAEAAPRVLTPTPMASPGQNAPVQAELFSGGTTRCTTAPQAAEPPPFAPAGADSPVDRATYATIFDATALGDIVDACRAQKALSIDLETTSLQANAADIVGWALCVPGHSAVYVPVGHRNEGGTRQLGAAHVLQALQPVLEDRHVLKWGQNIKYDAVVLRRAGVILAGIAHDAMLAAYVLDPARLSYGMDALARDFLQHRTITFDELTKNGRARLPMAEVSIERAATYAAEDADVAWRLGELLVAEVHKQGLGALYHDVEMPLVSVLADMESHGVLVHLAHLQRLAEEFNRRLVALEDRAYAEIGHPINIASPKQLSQLFFEKLQYPVIKKTKTGYSTDQEVLETLARTYPLPKIILEHRLLAKLKSTYVDALPRMVNPDTGRVHTSFNQTGTATGRLSSSDPNLQNIPIRGDDGRRIRAAIIAGPGCEIIAADYSQIELRVMAHLSGDPDFIEAFSRNEDIHRRTAMQILTGGSEPSGEMRRRAKTINFGILYGQSDFGLSRQLNIPRAEARAYIEAYFARFARVRAFMDETIAHGRRDGFVTTLLGRRRPVPNLNHPNGNLRQQAERIAINTPVQGTAADLIKLAMLHVAQRLTRERLAARMVLQVHDELVLESPLAEREAVMCLLREEMVQVRTLRVPIVVDVGVGPNWAEAH